MLWGGIACLVLALGAWALYRRDVARNAAAAGWPRAPGRIESSAVTFHRAEAENDYDSWTVDLVYSYAVDGASYSGSKIRLGAPKHHAVEREAEEEAAEFAAGSPVEVAYDPAAPRNAVLRTDRPSTSWRTFTWILAAIGVFLIVLSFLPSN